MLTSNLFLKDPFEYLSGNGFIKKLEDKFKKFYGFPFAILIPNATLGFFSIAFALDIKSKDEIIVPDLCWGGTIAPFLLFSCKICLVPGTETLNIDPFYVEKAVSENTKAIIAIDTFGVPHNMYEIRRIADKYKLLYIADVAQSFGAKISGQPSGKLADILILSLGPGKSLWAGEGGVILLKDKNLYEKIIFLTQHPYRQKKELQILYSNEFFINMRGNPFSAYYAYKNFGKSLRKLNKHINFCFKVLSILNKCSFCETIDFTYINITPSFHAFWALWKSKKEYIKVLNFLEKEGIIAKFQSPPLHLLSQNPFIKKQKRIRFFRNNNFKKYLERTFFLSFYSEAI